MSSSAKKTPKKKMPGYGPRSASSSSQPSTSAKKNRHVYSRELKAYEDLLRGPASGFKELQNLVVRSCSEARVQRRMAKEYYQPGNVEIPQDLFSMVFFEVASESQIEDFKQLISKDTNLRAHVRDSVFGTLDGLIDILKTMINDRDSYKHFSRDLVAMFDKNELLEGPWNVLAYTFIWNHTVLLEGCRRMNEFLAETHETHFNHRNWGKVDFGPKMTFNATMKFQKGLPPVPPRLRAPPATPSGGSANVTPGVRRQPGQPIPTRNSPSPSRSPARPAAPSTRCADVAPAARNSTEGIILPPMITELDPASIRVPQRMSDLPPRLLAYVESQMTEQRNPSDDARSLTSGQLIDYNPRSWPSLFIVPPDLAADRSMWETISDLRMRSAEKANQAYNSEQRQVNPPGPINARSDACLLRIASGSVSAAELEKFKELLVWDVGHRDQALGRRSKYETHALGLFSSACKATRRGARATETKKKSDEQTKEDTTILDNFVAKGVLELQKAERLQDIISATLFDHVKCLLTQRKQAGRIREAPRAGGTPGRGNSPSPAGNPTSANTTTSPSARARDLPLRRAGSASRQDSPRSGPSSPRRKPSAQKSDPNTRSRRPDRSASPSQGKPKAS